MNKELLHWVLIIALTTIGFFLLTGCANTQMANNIKAEAAWRAELAKDVANRNQKPESEYLGDVVLEVPADLYDKH